MNVSAALLQQKQSINANCNSGTGWNAVGIGSEEGFIQVDFGFSESSASSVVGSESFSQLHRVSILMVAIGNLYTRHDQLESCCRLTIGMQTGERCLSPWKVSNKAAALQRGAGLRISKICIIS